jgi:uncharacterized membrane protein
VRLIVAILSFLLATGLEAVGSFFCLIPTQGMHGNERFLPVFLGLSIAFVVVNLVGAAIGLFPLGIMYGVDAWWHAVLGFMAGSIPFALSLCVELELIPEAYANVLGPVRLVSLLVGSAGPPAGGLIALIAFRRRQRAARGGMLG